MTNVIATNQPLTMSSLEIAGLCDKEHRNVMADIKTMLEQLEISSAEFSAVYKAINGKTNPCFNLNKELSLTLVAGYNVKLRHKIIQRWQELESQQAPKLPATYIEALESLLATEKERARLESVNKALMHVSKLYSSTEIAKELGIRSGSKLNNSLRDKGIQYKTNGTWVLYAEYSEMDLTSIKQDVSPSGHTFYDRKWTQKGREFILALFSTP